MFVNSYFTSCSVIFSRKNSKKTGQETRSILDAAYADSGLALDFYTGFDAEWNDPASPVQVFPGFVEFLSFSELGDQGGNKKFMRPLVSNISRREL